MELLFPETEMNESIEDPTSMCFDAGGGTNQI